MWPQQLPCFFVLDSRKVKICSALFTSALALIRVNSSLVEANTIKLTTVERHVVFYFRLKQIERNIIGAGTWFGTQHGFRNIVRT